MLYDREEQTSHQTYVNKQHALKEKSPDNININDYGLMRFCKRNTP